MALLLLARAPLARPFGAPSHGLGQQGQRRWKPAVAQWQACRGPSRAFTEACGAAAGGGRSRRPRPPPPSCGAAGGSRAGSTGSRQTCRDAAAAPPACGCDAMTEGASGDVSRQEASLSTRGPGSTGRSTWHAAPAAPQLAPRSARCAAALLHAVVLIRRVGPTRRPQSVGQPAGQLLRTHPPSAGHLYKQQACCAPVEEGARGRLVFADLAGGGTVRPPRLRLQQQQAAAGQRRGKRGEEGLQAGVPPVQMDPLCDAAAQRDGGRGGGGGRVG